MLNELAHRLTESDSGSAWVRDAMADQRGTGAAVHKVMELRFGKQWVTYDPSDPEANLIAASQGYTVIPSASFNAAEWANIRHHQASLPAGRITPSPKPFSPGGQPLRILERKECSPALLCFESFAKQLAQELIQHPITIVFAKDSNWGFSGCYGRAQLTVNVYAKGEAWFNGPCGSLLERWVPFLIHEFAHDRVKGHLTDDYHRECCRLAGLLARLITENRAILDLLSANL